jgi:hypothetical protein
LLSAAEPALNGGPDDSLVKKKTDYRMPCPFRKKNACRSQGFGDTALKPTSLVCRHGAGASARRLQLFRDASPENWLAR